MTIKWCVCSCVFCRILSAHGCCHANLWHTFLFSFFFLTILHWNLLVVPLMWLIVVLIWLLLLLSLFAMFGIVHGHGTCSTKKQVDERRAYEFRYKLMITMFSGNHSWKQSTQTDGWRKKETKRGRERQRNRTAMKLSRVTKHRWSHDSYASCECECVVVWHRKSELFLDDASG